MERTEHSLVPQWLKSNGSVSSGASINDQLASTSYSEQITYSSFRRSSSTKGSINSRLYSGSGRSLHDRNWEKDIDNLSDKGKLVLGECKHNYYSDSLDNILSNRFEKDLLRRSQSMTSERWGKTWTGRAAGELSKPKDIYGKSDGMEAEGVVGSMHKTVFEEEFPLLGSDDKQGCPESGRVLSSGSGRPSNGLLTASTSAIIVSNGLTPACNEIPMTVGSSMAVLMRQHTVSANSSSTAPGRVCLSMAEKLTQGPPCPHTPPQSSVGTQKLEELAIKQSRVLIPMTPSMPRALVVSTLEKSKVKTGQQQHPFSYSRPSNHAPCGGSPAKSDVPKTTSVNSCIVSGSQELSGVSSAAKDCLSSDRSRVLHSPIGAATSSSISATSKNSSNDTNSNTAIWTTLEKRPASLAQSRSEFFRNLAMKSSSKNHCSDPCLSDMSCALEKSEVVTGNVNASSTLQSRDAPSVNTSAVNSSTESSGVITDNGNATNEPLNSSNAVQHLSTNAILYPDEEEVAFLRSLGWEESVGEDEGLTEEEIRDFYEKYIKLQPLKTILQKVHLQMMALPLDSSSGSCDGAPSGLSSSA